MSLERLRTALADRYRIERAATVVALGTPSLRDWVAEALLANSGAAWHEPEMSP